jgi:putative Ca2+/H+ antiporter (TMEM165/GDT1 family)
MKAYAMVFLSIFLAELGDKTQLATVLFASEAALSRWGVLAAAAAALVLSTALAVVAGGWLGAWLPARHLKLAAGLGFVAIGVWLLARGWTAA